MIKRVLLICALTVCAFTITNAQEKKPAPAVPETVRLEGQSQQEVAEAQRLANEARSAAETASARYDAAQQKVVTAIFKAMAESGLKPKEWTVKQDQAGIYFERLKPPAATASGPLQVAKPPGTDPIPGKP